ncbi:hypothetical protein GGX14DRAFT_472710 [Mycena pura]|uniref:Uncharacterized protein n=1 Tax=Mycena pura TaxID=153505 RepID=A0AAD6UX02_9AGAR|nr:hypothetical protein GGX14DRAFT_472710 [Mycena pura]
MTTIAFIGAPSAFDIHRKPTEYHWHTVTSRSTAEPSSVYPPATLQAASRRISLMYQNVIFNDSEEENYGLSYETSLAEGDDQDETSIPSFLNVSKSFAPRPETQFETQESQSYNYSDASSIARFPAFHFSLNALASLTSLCKSRVKGTAKVTLLLAVLEVDGPDTFRFKQGKDAGKESFVLKMILGDDEGNVCKLTAWREVAQDWGGCGDEIGAKRGDVLLLTDVMAAFEPATTVSLTASPWQKPKMEICYRTMPYAHEDQRLRPDLRLGASDASVRRVAAVVRWFESMAGLTG